MTTTSAAASPEPTPPDPAPYDTFPPKLPGWNAPRRWTDSMEDAAKAREDAVKAVIAELSIGPKYAALVTESRRIRAEQKQLRGLNDSYDLRRRKAHDEDVADAAAASRRGDTDPGDIRQRAVDDEHTANLRRHDVLSRAFASVEADLRGLAREPGLVTEIDGRLTAEKAAATLALASLDDTLRRMAGLRAVRVWSIARGEHGMPSAAETQVPLGDGLSLSAVLAALSALVE